MVKYITEICHGKTHIEKVKLSNGTILRKEEVVNKINKGIETFYTKHKIGKGAKVITFICGKSYCIRSVPDETTKDNLGDLPRFNC